ncbi:DUF935 domain-containing protein [Candidatus Magnetomonas plexicatena]|uniref:DUF935 domain-containing protein n=1 Tax=Candidatus Magnetomonas plexicatena TaxID=2552947 RepID=UPI001C76DAB6|nr:DUF935 family protein [Nitrospirales bacterium LBB_01]
MAILNTGHTKPTLKSKNAATQDSPVYEEVSVVSVRDRYNNYPSEGLTPERLSRIFKEADSGNITRQAELFSEIEEKDPHLGSILQIRKAQTARLGWEILPASDSQLDVQIAQSAKEMFDYIENFEDALMDMLDAIGKGFSVLEILWSYSEGKVWIDNLKWVNQKRFTFFSKETILPLPNLITDSEPIYGEQLPPNKFVIHKYRSRSGILPRAGLLRPCAYMYLFKTYGIKDWVVYNELFSVPMRIGKYKSGAGKGEIEALKQAVFNLSVDSAAVISDNTLIELLESKINGNSSAFNDFISFCDKSMTKAILGHTAAVESMQGKLGSEQEAQNVRQDLLESDAVALAKTIKTYIITPWVKFNFGPNIGIPKFRFNFEDKDDLEKTANTYKTLVSMGFTEISTNHIYEKFGIPKPIEGEKTLGDNALKKTNNR